MTKTERVTFKGEDPRCLRVRLGVEDLDRKERERRESLLLLHLLVLSRKEKKRNGRMNSYENASSQIGKKWEESLEKA